MTGRMKGSHSRGIARRTPFAAVACWILLSAGAACAAAQTGVISLAGEWRFEIDRNDTGVRDRWFERNLRQAIRLPGVMQAQGYGDEISINTPWTGDIVDKSWFTAPEYAPYREPGNVKVPFWLQPDRYYVGAAWYQREIEIPSSWEGKNVSLKLERPHWETTVFLDDREVGRNDSLSTPHEYELGTALKGGPHRLTVRVDNRMIVGVGVNSHSVSDHTQGNWNGIAGRIEIRARPPVRIVNLQVYPDVAAGSVHVRGRIANSTGRAGSGIVRLQASLFNDGRSSTVVGTTRVVSWGTGGGIFESEYKLGSDPLLWSEFQPALYRMTAALSPGDESVDVTFGLREISTQGTRFILNGRPIFLRGTLECAIFPKTGHPPTDVESWLRVVRAAKEHGLNHIRFHSWCPPEAAFIAADQLGFYYQVECGSWANQGARLGVGNPIDKWLYEEADRILEQYGNHPSFLLMPYGNEPAGDINRYLGLWVSHYKAKDPRRLYTSAAGWPQIPENQFHVAPEPRIQAWGAGLKSRINALPPETVTDYGDYIRSRSVPVISHEIGQWCVYPNFDEIPKYTGYLKPRNLEIFRASLEANGMGELAREFLVASGKLQALCYKEEIESALRTPGMGGFQLLDLHDFPGQGTALVGVLDPFWESKGYIEPEEYRRFCNSTVPLARLRKRVFTTEETLEADLEVAHFGSRPLRGARLYWKVIAADGHEVDSGELPPLDLPIGNGMPLGTIRASLASLKSPAKYQLVAGVVGTPFENDWDIWVYPSKTDDSVPEGVTRTDRLDDAARTVLESGGRVLMEIPPERVAGDRLGRVATGFSSIFWNTAWTRRQPPHTLGILCDPTHPALASFPTESHSNWQWWYLISHSQAMILEGLPRTLRPIIRLIDDWVTNRRLALAFEARVGRGRILVTSIDLSRPAGDNPVLRQMRASLFEYLRSDRFRPETEVSIEQLRHLVVHP